MSSIIIPHNSVPHILIGITEIKVSLLNKYKQLNKYITAIENRIYYNKGHIFHKRKKLKSGNLLDQLEKTEEIE